MFKIRHLDHVAIRVRDIERSADWYESVLGLTRFSDPENWGPFPINMLAGKTGIALFPAKTDSPEKLPPGDWLVPTHFAFRVTPDEFERARSDFEREGIEFELQDHVTERSLFIEDPDGNAVELVMEVV